MASKLKPVDNAPICDPAYIRRIDPVWICGNVPPRFWEDRGHRRDYLLWIADGLGLRRMADLYQLKLTQARVRQHRCRIVPLWGRTALNAVQDCFPEHDWKPWLFATLPNGFWNVRANRLSYIEWLGKQLKCRRTEDWYRVGFDDFLRNRGRGMMYYYRSSPALAVIDLVPAREWCEWKFFQVPKGFWDSAENRHRYLRWLGRELGYRRTEDWYQIQTYDLLHRCGGTLLVHYRSIYVLMREFLPQLDWDRIDVHRALTIEQILHWADSYRAQHGRWPTSESGEVFSTGETWWNINVALRHGHRGLPGASSLPKLLLEHRGKPLERLPRLSEEQILRWADAHRAAYGKWPTRNSGPIAGTTETWVQIAAALCQGQRGLSGLQSLAQLLARRRGKRNHMRLPRLTQGKILAWAKAYFKTHGRWPNRQSGPIANSRAETWCAVDSALAKGCRGLPGGSSLAKLLRKRGLK